MTASELRRKLIDQINRMSFQKLLFLENLIQSLEIFSPEAQTSDFSIEAPDSSEDISQIRQPVVTLETHFLSESTLRKDWLSAEEDRAWQDL